ATTTNAGALNATSATISNTLMVTGATTLNGGATIKNGLDLSNSQITNLASGGTTDSNAANIGDVSRIAKNLATIVTSTAGSVTVTNTTATNGQKTYNVEVNTTKLANDVTFKYSGDNNTNGENALSSTTKFEGTAGEIVTTAANGKVSFKLDETIKNKINTASNDIASKGLTFNGNSGSTSTRKLGDTLNISGANSNIQTNASGENITITLSNTLNLTNSGSINFGDNGATLNQTGLTIPTGNDNKKVSVTKDGINAGSKVISGVADGTANDHAVNLKQLNDAKAEAGKGWNITVSNVDGGQSLNATDTKVAPGAKVTYTAGKNIKLTQNGADITITTTDNVTFDNLNVTTKINTAELNASKAVVGDGGLTVNGEARLKDTDIDGDLTVQGSQTVEGDQFVEGSQTVDGEQTVKGDSLVEGNQTVEGDSTVKGNQTVEQNLTVNGTTNLKNTNVDGNLTVTTGNSTFGNTIIGGAGKTFNVANGTTIDMGGNTINNITSGTIEENNNQAVTGGMVHKTVQSLIDGGIKFFGNDGTLITTKLGNQLNITGGAKTVGNYSSNNVKTISNSTTGSLTIEFAENPVFNDIIASGDLTVNGTARLKDTDIDGDLTVQGSQTVEGDQFVEGSQTVDGEQTVKGDSLVEGNQTVEGDSTVKGNQTVEKDLTVNGTSNLKDTNVEGDLSVTGNQTVEGDSTILGNQTVEGDQFVGGELTVEKDANIKGNTTLEKDLTVNGTSNLKDTNVEG
ncbi:beta strand repeat-containing protein, partial [Ursidibacter arcticus]